MTVQTATADHMDWASLRRLARDMRAAGAADEPVEMAIGPVDLFALEAVAFAARFGDEPAPSMVAA